MNKDIINPTLTGDIKALIQNAKQQAAIAINAELTLLYWQVGKRISDEILKGQRGEYGQQIIATLAQQLSAEFGRGWSKRNLAHMVRFVECFPDTKILHALRTQLSWTHFRQLLAIDEPLKRDFYVQMTITSRWSTRTLAERIDSQLYERTAISKKPEQTIAKELQHLQSQGQISQDLLFKDPYLLDFLELNDHYLEKDLEIVHLTAETLKRHRLTFLPLTEQKIIAQYLKEQNKKFDVLMEKRKRQIGLLRERRAALISAAVTVKIDVRDWQPLMEKTV